MGSLYTADQIPTTSEQAIREFRENYLMAVTNAKPSDWAGQFGDIMTIGAPRATFPISTIAAKYRETREETGRFRRFNEKSFDMKVVEFDDGFEIEALQLFTNAFAARQWANVPEQFTIAEQRHVNRNLVTLLEAGTGTTLQTCPWDGLAFFTASHLADPLGDTSNTFSNYQVTGKAVDDVTKVEEEVTLMRAVKDPNGEKLGVEPTDILVPTAKFQKTVNLFKQDLIANAAGTATIRNPFFGTFNIVHVPELIDADDWYLVDRNLAKRIGVSPWAATKYLPPADLGLRFFDESSDHYKTFGNLKVGSHIWYAFALVLPHAIRLVKGA